MLSKVYKFEASWCGPCKAFAPTFERVKNMEEFSNIEFKEIDVEEDENEDNLAEKYKIQSVPTTILLNENGEVLYKVMGNVSEKDFIEIIQQAKNKNIKTDET